MKRDRFVDLAERIAGAISGGAELVFVFAPTGYGKTMASPYLLKALRDRGLASRLVHVVPTRALLRQAYADKFAPAGEKLGFTTAYQSHDMIPESTKSPYFLADLTVTTLESFLLNAYKLQPAELSKLIEGSSHGHYYPAVTALSSSVVVFDEAHIYVGDSSEKSTAMLVAAAMGALLKLGVPCVIETATMPTALLESLRRALSISRGGSRAKAIYLCPEGGDCAQVRALSEIGVSVEKVEPVDWRENPERWATRLASREEALEEVRQKCGEKLVLYVSNSVERAVELYEKLRDECDSTLVHARLSEADREKAESELREKERGLVVGSPVIEVGVDVDAQVLVTEPAPLENIAQRAGRLCRKRECREAELILVDDEELIGPYDHASAKRALEELRRVAESERVDWRALWSSDGRRSYVELLERIAGELGNAYSVNYVKVLENIILNDPRPGDYVESILGQFQGAWLTKVAVRYDSPGDLGRHYVLVDLESLRRLSSCLEVDERGVELVAVVLSSRGGGGGEMHAKLCFSQSLKRAIAGSGYRLAELYRNVRKELERCLDSGEKLVDYFVKARRGSYRDGLGLLGARC